MSTDTSQLAEGVSPAGVTLLGLAVNVLLSTAKIVAGLVCCSQAILADGLHSLSDLVTDIAVLTGIRISSRPADERHHYGHRRAMTLVTAVLGIMLLVAAGIVGYRALREFTVKLPPPIRATLPLVLAVVSVLVKELLYRLTVRVGRRFGDMSVVANAWHHRSDALTSIVAAAGLTAVMIGGQKWRFLDSATALVLGAFLAVVAWRILRDATGELMDRAPAPATLAEIRSAVEATDGVRGFHAFRARRLGERVEMDIHVLVDPELTVRNGHDIASDVRRQVEQRCPDVANVIVHVEPSDATANDD